MLANGGRPVIDMVFIKHNDRIALIARYASANNYTHIQHLMVCSDPYGVVAFRVRVLWVL